jgi:hypothetical protein
MKRTNTFELRPRSESDEALLQEVMDATASFWNELTYARRQQFFDDESIWETDEFRGQYKGQLGAAGVQTVTRKNNAAWNSFFALLESGEDACPATGETQTTGVTSGCSFETTHTKSSGANTPGSKFRSARTSKTSTTWAISSAFDWRSVEIRNGPANRVNWRSSMMRSKTPIGHINQ